MSTVHICLNDIFGVAVACEVIFYPGDTPFSNGTAMAVSGSRSIRLDAGGNGSVALQPGRYAVRFSGITGNTDTLLIQVPNDDDVYPISELICGGNWVLPMRDFLQKSKNLGDVADPAAAFDAIKQVATLTTAGAICLASQAEADAGTDAVKAVTPATLASLAKWASAGQKVKCITVADAAARLELTHTQAATGDLVEQADTRGVYEVLDATLLNHEWGYVQIGTRSAVATGLRLGLIAEYLFANGAELADTSGNGNDLTNVNGVAIANGVATFDGTNYLQSAATNNGGTEATYAAVIGYSSWPESHYAIPLCDGLRPLNSGVWIGIANLSGLGSDGNPAIWAGQYGQGETPRSNGIAPGSHVVVIRFDSENKVFECIVDGVSQGTQSGASQISAVGLTLGMADGTGLCPYFGTLQKVRAWSRALTDDEVAQLSAGY